MHIGFPVILGCGPGSCGRLASIRSAPSLSKRTKVMFGVLRCESSDPTRRARATCLCAVREGKGGWEVEGVARRRSAPSNVREEGEKGLSFVNGENSISVIMLKGADYMIIRRYIIRRSLGR